VTELAYRLQPLDRDGAPLPGSELVHLTREAGIVGTRIRLPVVGVEEWEVVAVVGQGADRADAPRIISARNAAGEDVPLGGTLVIRGVPRPRS
jgi:hypothetical protein